MLEKRQGLLSLEIKIQVSIQFCLTNDRNIHVHSDMCICCCYLVAKLCPTLCNPKDCSKPGSSVLHYLPDFAQTHVYPVGDAI